jgi:4-amino-4-deoxy-L-arabinose transferase-like glycosyltransferase
MRRTILALAVFVLALVPRVLNLDAFVTPDEMRWVCRAANFRDALRLGRLAETYQTEHPGVTTMALGALALPPESQIDWPRVCSTDWAQGDNPQPDIEYYTGRRLRAVGIFQARLPVAVTNAAIVAGIFLLAEPLLGPLAGLVGAVLVALDPFYLAHSRLLHVDALPTGFMTLSVLSLTVYVTEGRRQKAEGRSLLPGSGWLLLSGALAGLATLSKSPSLILGPFTVLVLVTWAMWEGRQKVEASSQMSVVSNQMSGYWLLLSVIVWGIGWAVATFALWPALWVAPVETVRNVLSAAVGYAQAGHSNPNFFQGVITDDPGGWFYPTAFWFRVTPLVVVGLVASLLYMAAGWKQKADGKPFLPSAFCFLLFVVMYAGLMTLGAKKFDRYLLPVFPVLDLTAGVGLAWLGMLVGRALRLRPALAAGATVGAILVGAGWTSLPHHPYYLTYYNPLAGGGQAAVRTLLVGWGEGLDQAARYLNARPDARGLRTVSANHNELGVFFAGRTDNPWNYDPGNTDYIVLYVDQVQRDLFPELIADAYKAGSPEYTVRLHGIDYAWIYRNVNREQPVRVRHFDVPTMQHTLHANLGDGVRLLGYDLDHDQVAPGGTLVVTLYWQAREPMRRSYHVFTHLLDAASQIRGQHDGIPDGNSYPTDRWAEGEVVADRHELQVSPDTSPGELQLSAGMYWKDERLPAFDGDGQRLPEDRVVLGSVRVVP